MPLKCFPRSKRRIKTLRVSELKKWFNSMLADPEMNMEQRRLISCLLEELLHATKNYRGFNYNYWADHGIAEWEKAGKPTPVPDKFLHGSDDTLRRHYY